MKRYCTMCKNFREIVWSDSEWETKLEINLCIDCLKFHMPYELKNLKKCPKCGNFYVAKESWKRTCFECWKKANPQKNTKKFKINLNPPLLPEAVPQLVAPTTTI